MSEVEKAKVAYHFVRDEIPHSFDCNARVITASASDVLIHQTGICHAKANLLAALLRFQNIPTGFCFQHITLSDDDSLGYCVHAYNAVFWRTIGSGWMQEETSQVCMYNFQCKYKNLGRMVVFYFWKPFIYRFANLAFVNG
ncbi:transglutaminase domain-containing protein [Acetobacterium sp.]|uniref:transglutaminase domain-containing protein n=1 Tax=Acetobacterium sp. TaxID=1872094 RepID=UPI002F42BC4A